MRNVSVLGSSGWLGKPLTVSLAENGYHVKASTRTNSKLSDLEAEGIESYFIDIEEFEEFDLFLNSDVLLIMITSKDIESYSRLIAQIHQSSIQKVVFVSSTSVYPNNNSVVTEDNTVIEKSLTQIENLFMESKGFDTTILRFAGLFGPNRHPGNWFTNGRKIPQPEGCVNMIHQEDCVNIIHEILEQDCWNMIFNACSNHHPKRRDYYTAAKKSLGFDSPIFVEGEATSFKIINSDKLQKILNYRFLHDNLLDFSESVFE